MDVVGAFNNVYHDRFIHNLRKLCMLETISRWITSFLRGRNMCLQFNSLKSGCLLTPASVPQGSPLSLLLYMYYNVDFLNIAAQHQATGPGFIDNIIYGVQGYADKGNICKLKCILNEAEEWRKKHRAQFEISKYILVHYTQNRWAKTKVSVTVNRIMIKPSYEARYLGVMFDQELCFKTHL